MNNKKILTSAICLSIMSGGIMASNSAYAITKQELKNDLKNTFSFNFGDGNKQFSDSQLKRWEDFLDQCGDLTEDQYDLILEALFNAVAAINNSSSKSAQEVNKDPKVINNLRRIASNLAAQIDGLSVTFEEDCALCGTISRNNATLTFSTEDFQEGLTPMSSSETSGTKSGTSTGSSSGSDSVKSDTSDEKKKVDHPKKKPDDEPKCKSKDKKVIKGTGMNIDFGTASLVGIASLLTTVGAMVIARKKRLFDCE